MKNEKEIEFLVNAIRIFRQDEGMECRNEKCAMIIKRRETRERIEQLNQENIRTFKKTKNKKQTKKKPTNLLEYLERKFSSRTNGDQRKSKKGVPQKNKKTYQNQTLPFKSNQGYKYLHYKIL